MEAMEFSSFLRLSQALDEKARTAFIETIIEMLDLVKVAHERISDILLHQVPPPPPPRRWVCGSTV